MKNTILFENLSGRETVALLKFPAYISMFATRCDNKLDEEEKSRLLNLLIPKPFPVIRFLLNFIRRPKKFLKII